MFGKRKRRKLKRRYVPGLEDAVIRGIAALDAIGDTRSAFTLTLWLRAAHEVVKENKYG